MMQTRNRYTIGEMSEICDISAKTLRYYDQIGLLQPEHKNTENGYRYYSKKQAFTIYIIKQLQKIGFSLKEIEGLIREEDSARFAEALGKKIALLDRRIEEMKKLRTESSMLLEKVSLTDGFLEASDRLNKDGLLPSAANPADGSVSIEEIPHRTVLFTTKVMQLYNNFEISIERWFEIFRLAERKGLLSDGNILLTYHTENAMDQFYKPQCKLEISLPIALSPEDSVSRYDPAIRTIGGYQAAVIYHCGAYETIIQSHLKLLRWLEMNGYRISGFTSEEYVISPFDFKSKENFLTKIIYPVEKQE